jgi:eukaryotic-like serine/threonine-protein kinase
MQPDSPLPNLGDLDSLRMQTPVEPGPGAGRSEIPTNLTGHPTPAFARTPPSPERGNPEGARAQPPEAASASGPFPFLRPPLETDEIGRLGNYRVLTLLGQGGMGIVFQAEDIALRRPVALKVMKPELIAHPDSCKRFLREAQTMAAGKHDHLVTVYQVGQENNVIYLAMELLDGETLDAWISREGPAPLGEILRIGREMAGGLAIIHAKGLVHRDIKPDNIWLEAPARRVKILDFGLARIVDQSTRLTDAGSVVGTPDFMSPEQARGDEIDARSDLFSLGGVLYRLGTGRNPFQAGNLMGVLTALAVAEPRPVEELNPALPRDLGDLVMQLLAKEPDDRPDSAAAVVEELERIENGLTAPFLPVKPASRSAKTRSRSKSLRLDRSPSHRTATWVIVGAAALATALVILLVQKINRPAAAASPAAASSPELAKHYLSTMTPATQENWPGRQPPPIPGLPPGTVRVKGNISAHGIFMHAVPPHEGPARVSYRLGKQFSTLHVEISLNDGPPRAMTPCTFHVYGDGKPLWTTRPVVSQEDTQTQAIDVRGVETITLEVRCPGDPRGAHMVWIEPYLEK